ncbi:N-acetyl-alpha-D-glucosaminyl L-malate synthase BshA [Candidatus Riflebacteria bacterium]
MEQKKINRPMRLGIICHSSMGGSSRIAGELACELGNRGHKIHMFSRTLPFSCSDGMEGISFHINRSDIGASLCPATLYTDWNEREIQTFLLLVRDVLERDGLDLLHFHYAVPFAQLAERIKNKMGKNSPRLVGTLHGTDVSIFGRDPSFGARLGETLKKMDALTTVSFAHARLAAELFEFSQMPEVIPNFVNLDEFFPHDLPDKNLVNEKNNNVKNPGKAILVHMSNFRPVKEPLMMAKIFHEIQKEIPSELWLVGDGPEMAKVREYFLNHGLQKNVRYWGPCKEIGPILAQADLMLLTSLSESFCLAALEAMACGLPVLATRVGGLPEVVIHGKTGFLFPPGETQIAAEMGKELLSDPLKLKFMGKTAAQQAKRFDKKTVVTIYESMYQRVLGLQKDQTLNPDVA